MEFKTIYRCEDSMDGVFSALYEAWKSRRGEEEIGIEIVASQGNELCLFTEYCDVAADREKSVRVQKAVKERVSEETMELVKKAALSKNPEKGTIIFRFLNYAFREGKYACRSYGNPWAMKLFEIVRNYGNEVHHWLGFLRFEQLDGGAFFARFIPCNNVLGEVMQHFSDRMNGERFMVLDETYRVLGVYAPGSQWFLYRLNDEEYRRLDGMDGGKDCFKGCWKAFYESIMIRERENKALQRNNLPLRYRAHMTEFRD